MRLILRHLSYESHVTGGESTAIVPGSILKSVLLLGIFVNPNNTLLNSDLLTKVLSLC